jgi:hypothetical protein
MPFKSKAQLRKFGVLLKQGKITKQEFEKWVLHTPNIKKLPQRVGSKNQKYGKNKKRK